MSTTQKDTGNRWVALGFTTAMAVAMSAVWLSQPSHGVANADGSSLTNAEVSGVFRPQFADIIAASQPSVVTISVEKSPAGAQQLNFGGAPGQVDEFLKRFFGRQMPMPEQGKPMRGVGSGFVIDSEGYIVTNNHVIDGAESITVTLHNGKQHRAELLGKDPKTDLALLKIEAGELAESRFGDSDQARVGDWVVAIGNPFGFGGTATVGIISARGRDLRAGPYDDFLQIDAPINQGNSGGPIFNTAGEVIGVNTAIFSPNGGNVGIGFAIPAKMAENVISELRENGSVDRGWLGVQLQTMDEMLANSLGLASADGALVAEVLEDSPAQSATLQAGDVIVEFNGRAVASPKELSRMVGASNSRDSVKIKVWRNGDHETLRAKLGSPDEPVLVTSNGGDDEVGLALAPLDKSARARLGLSEDVEGAVIARVKPSSIAAKRGLAAGDVVVRIDEQRIVSPSDVETVISKARRSGKQSVLVLLRRGETQRYAALPIG